MSFCLRSLPCKRMFLAYGSPIRNRTTRAKTCPQLKLESSEALIRRTKETQYNEDIGSNGCESNLFIISVGYV